MSFAHVLFDGFDLKYADTADLRGIPYSDFILHYYLLTCLLWVGAYFLWVAFRLHRAGHCAAWALLRAHQVWMHHPLRLCRLQRCVCVCVCVCVCAQHTKQHAHTHKHTLTHTLPRARARALSLSLSLVCVCARSLSLTLSLSLSRARALSLSRTQCRCRWHSGSGNARCGLNSKQKSHSHCAFSSLNRHPRARTFEILRFFFLRFFSGFVLNSGAVNVRYNG
jgi:hypothetical protein